MGFPFRPLTIRLAIAAASILAWALLVWVLAAPVPRVPLPPPSPYDAHMAELDRQAADAAYVAQLTSLFGVWMRDEHDQPIRAMTGANRARHAYVGVLQEIDRRERARGGNP